MFEINIQQNINLFNSVYETLWIKELNVYPKEYHAYNMQSFQFNLGENIEWKRNQIIKIIEAF